MMPRGSQLGTQGQKRKTSKFFFSETGFHEALIFGMKHLLVDLHNYCSYDVPWVKTGPTPWGHNLKNRNKKGKLQNSFSLKLDVIEV